MKERPAALPSSKPSEPDMALTPTTNTVRPERWQQRWLLITEKIQVVDSPADEQSLLQRMGAPTQPVVVAFANAHAMNTVARSRSFFDALHLADCVLRDGSGMKILFRLLGQNAGLNLNGTDLIPRIIGQFDGRRIALFGTQEPYLQRGMLAAHQYAPRSEFVTADGFLELNAYLSLAMAQKSDLIVLGMGMPKQELVAQALRTRLNFPCTIVCGGAIIDFLAERTARAPMWLRKAGMEWAYRLAKEPTRLFHRYIVGNPVFLLRAMWMAASTRR